METTITITTIHKPTFIEDLCANINEFGHSEETNILVIGDLKTPPIKDYLKRLSKKFNVSIQYLDIEAQEDSLSDCQPLLELFDYNTPDRVILGGMFAYLQGTKRIIAVDDDNFVTENDFVGYHSITGITRDELPLLKNKIGWFNVHVALEEKFDIPFYPRGYPFSKRVKESNKADMEWGKKKVIVNQGLVLEDPDIDAITRLVNPICATNIKYGFGTFGLLNTWSPFNYQNTCLCRELIPCYFRPKSGLRNADIWTSYLFNKLAEHFGDTITFGQPLVKQIRNEHNLFDDLDIELENNKETDYFVELVRNTPIKTKSNYFEALYELVDNLSKNVDNKYPMAVSFFKEYLVWCEVVGNLYQTHYNQKIRG